MVSPERRMVTVVRRRLGPNRGSERRACRVLSQSRSTQRYQRRLLDDEAALLCEMRKLCMAVGSTEVDPMFPKERETWLPLTTQWYRRSPDSGIHGAAGWMLRRWKMELPVIAITIEPPENKKWHVTPSGMTMVKIPAGEFLNRMKGD
ncbi:MAG: hypothetical protein ACI87E_004281 [Mariniblastus sp.]